MHAAMSNVTCPGCSWQSSEDNVYCPNCARILHCPHCKALLLQLPARFCGQCAKPLPEAASNPQVQMADTVELKLNHLRIHETSEVRDLEADFSDAAIGHFGDLISRLVGPRLLGNHRDSDMQQQGSREKIVEVHSETPYQDSSPIAALPDASSQPGAMKQSASSRDGSEDGIWQIFSHNEGNLQQETHKLRASTKRDFTVRLVYLYLYAKYKLGIEKVPRTEVFNMLEEAKVKDNNIYHYLEQESGYIQSSDGYLRLNLDGRNQVQHYIAEVLNNDLPDGWHPGNENHTTAKPKVTTKHKRTNDEASLVSNWIAQEASKKLAAAISHSYVHDLSVLHQALLALYGISLMGGELEVTPTSIAQYLYGAFQVTVSADSLGKALRIAIERKTGVVSHPDGGGYRITPTGRALVEKMLQEGAQP